jgi:uncharacterized protein YggE
MNHKVISTVGFAFIFAALITAIAYLMPWETVNWGNLQLKPSSTVTVTGTAQSQEKNQVATFTAGVSSTQDDKQKAINEVNQKIANMITRLKDFGIDEKDLETSNLSIYQNQESYWEGDRQKYRPGQWNVNNSLTIKLRDVEKSSNLTVLLSETGATNVYGPSFSLDSTTEIQKTLYSGAIEDARQKAAEIAKSSNKKLGKVISVTEGSLTGNFPFTARMEGAGGGGGMPYEPGSGKVTATLTVVFELK